MNPLQQMIAALQMQGGPAQPQMQWAPGVQNPINMTPPAPQPDLTPNYQPVATMGIRG